MMSSWWAMSMDTYPAARRWNNAVSNAAISGGPAAAPMTADTGTGGRNVEYHRRQRERVFAVVYRLE